MSKPWKVVPHSAYPGIVVIEGLSFPITVVLDALDLTLDDKLKRVSDANLVAAAPDLLEALNRLTKWAEIMAEAQTCEHTGDHPIAIARTALIKAMTGESS